MRSGCISLGNIKCDKCNRNIPYPERYLSLEEAKDNHQILCMDCCQGQGLIKAGPIKKDGESFFNLSTD